MPDATSRPRHLRCSPAARLPHLLGRVARPLALVALLLLLAPGCGGSSGGGPEAPGTVAILNQTDQGQAPRIVEQFFLEPVGGGPTVGNRLKGVVPPGGVVIVGLFPPGLYNATAVLEGGVNQNWVDEEIRPGEPKNFVISPPP